MSIRSFAALAGKLTALLFIALLLPLSFSVKAHPLKMAYTAVRYNPQKKVFEISHRVFQDDFENTLKSAYGYTGGDVFVNRNSAAVQKPLTGFFDKNFRISLGGANQKLRYTGMEQKNQMGIIVWFETVRLDESAATSVEIYNYIMMESFREQVNMFSLNANGMKRTLKFTVDNVRQRL